MEPYSCRQYLATGVEARPRREVRLCEGTARWSRSSGLAGAAPSKPVLLQNHSNHGKFLVRSHDQASYLLCFILQNKENPKSLVIMVKRKIPSLFYKSFPFFFPFFFLPAFLSSQVWRNPTGNHQLHHSASLSSEKGSRGWCPASLSRHHDNMIAQDSERKKSFGNLWSSRGI